MIVTLKNFKNKIFKKTEQKYLYDEWASAKNAEVFLSLIDRLPNPDLILKKAGKNISVLRNLINHYQVGGCIEQRKAGTKSCKWNLIENNCNKSHYDIYDYVFKNIDIHNLISSILDTPLFGYVPIEIIWEKFDNYILPIKCTAKPQEWFYFNSYGDFFFKDRNNGGKRFIDLENSYKFLLPRNNADFLNPYGQAILSRCFWNVAFINGGMEFWAKFTEKYGMPYMFGKYDRSMTDPEKTALLESLVNMVQAAVGVIPSDGSVEVVDTGSSGNTEIYERFVNKCENNISKSILGQTLTTDIGSAGSYAASKTHANVRADIVDSDKILVENTINQLIKYINDINFRDEEIPTFAFVSAEDLGLEKAERDNKVSNLGVKFTKKYLVRTYGYKEDDIEIIEQTKNVMNFSDRIGGFKTDQLTFDLDGNGESSGSFKTDQLTSDSDGNEKSISGDYDKLAQLTDIKDFQKIMSPEINKIVEFFNKTSNAEETLDKLADLYPNFNTKQLEEMLAKVIFISELLGRLSCQQK